MPLYSYKCSECGFEDDYLERTIDQTPFPKKCPKCDKDTFFRMVSKGTSFQLKGDGWYKPSVGNE